MFEDESEMIMIVSEIESKVLMVELGIIVSEERILFFG